MCEQNKIINNIEETLNKSIIEFREMERLLNPIGRNGESFMFEAGVLRGKIELSEKILESIKYLKVK